MHIAFCVTIELSGRVLLQIACKTRRVP